MLDFLLFFTGALVYLFFIRLLLGKVPRQPSVMSTGILNMKQACIYLERLT